MKILQENHNIELVCHELNFKKGASSLHWHDKIEICKVLNNNCKFKIEGKIISASVGDIVFIEESIIHQFLIDENDTRILVCQFPLNLLLNLSQQISLLKPHITHDEIMKVPNLEEKLSIIFSMMEQENVAARAASNPLLYSLVTSLYFLLERHFRKDETSFTNEQDRQEFFKIVEYINNHFHENLTLKDISKKLYMSRGRLASVFKKYAFEGLNQYINRLRIKNANCLLARGSSVTAAAIESGFQSIRTFNNVYKSIMNMTPSEYIKKK